MKQVIIIRKDLNMRKGKMIAQGAHASGIAMLRYLWHPYVWRWILSHYTKVVVSVENEAELLEKYAEVPRTMPCALIQDIGKTEFNGVPTYTALVIGPAPLKKINPITQFLKLL